MIKAIAQKNILFVAGLVMLMMAGVIATNNSNTAPIPLLLEDVAFSDKKLIDPKNLFDHNNNTVTLNRFLNHWTIVFFGYTNCPDVCPATISQLEIINERVQSKNNSDEGLQIFFVSVDPERDTVKRLANYMNYFGEPFIGMTGNENAINQFENQLGAYHRIEKKGRADHYSVQHSAYIYLINPDGRLIAKFRPPLNLDTVVEQLNMFIERFSIS